MKNNLKIIVLTGFFLLVFPAAIFNAGAAVNNLSPAETGILNDEIVTAFRTANATMLSAHFYSTIDLSIPGHDCACSKQQAEQIMKTFFTKYPPKSFKINHQGSSREGSQYFIGTYVTDKGTSLRVYILMKKQGNVQLIQQIQVEEE